MLDIVFMRTSRRPSRGFSSVGAGHDRRRAMPCFQRNQDDFAAVSPNEIRADQGGDGVIGALDQHVRLEKPDKLQRRVLFEQDHQIDAAD